MRIVGLTGGIACGKSSFVNEVIKMGVPVLDCDKIAKEAPLHLDCGCQNRQLRWWSLGQQHWHRLRSISARKKSSLRHWRVYPKMLVMLCAWQDGSLDRKALGAFLESQHHLYFLKPLQDDTSNMPLISSIAAECSDYAIFPPYLLAANVHKLELYNHPLGAMIFGDDEVAVKKRRILGGKRTF